MPFQTYIEIAYGASWWLEKRLAPWSNLCASLNWHNSGDMEEESDKAMKSPKLTLLGPRVHRPLFTLADKSFCIIFLVWELVSCLQADGYNFGQSEKLVLDLTWKGSYILNYDNELNNVHVGHCNFPLPAKLGDQVHILNHSYGFMEV